MERMAAASLYVWFGLFRGVRGFLVVIVTGELLDSERVEDGDDECEVHEVEGDLISSKFSLYALPPPLKQEDILGLQKCTNQMWSFYIS